jgi:hypothetical protein
MRNNPAHGHRRGRALAAGAALTALAVAGCGAAAGSPVVPSLSQSATQAAAGAAAGGAVQGDNAARASVLHAAAQCIRQHGVPGYAEPVLTPSGAVYSDLRSIEDASQSVISAIRQACGSLLAAANLNPVNEPPAPPQLVQVGVRSAECLRTHGMPNVTDPTAQSPYTPGHGFGMNASEMPAGGKASPVWRHASQACHAQITAEIQASTLGSLSDDG